MYISTFVLAERLKLDTMLVRKDLAMVGVPGRPRRGYPAKELQGAINRVLGWDNATDAVLVGVGSLGSALLGYSGFEEQTLSIVVAFDSDCGKILVEQLSRSSNEGYSLKVLVFARSFSYKHQIGVPVSASENTVGACFVKCAFRAGSATVFKLVPCHFCFRPF